MATTIKGKYTILEVVNNTYQTKFKNRFVYMRRDVLTKVIIEEVTELSADRHTQPTKKYVFTTVSYPQYRPYISSATPRQRRVKHEYLQTLEMDVMSVNTKAWKYRLGTQRPLPRSVPSRMLRTISRDEMAGYINDREKAIAKLKEKAERRGMPRSVLLEKIKKIREQFKRKINKRRRSARYLNEGDYIARVYGINLDFHYKLENLYAISGPNGGHLYGKNLAKRHNQNKIIFFPKHALRLIDFLLKKKILSKD